MAEKHRAPPKSRAPKRERERGKPKVQFAEPLNHEQARMQKWLKQVRFKRAVLGVNEADLWKKLAELNALYEAALSAERARYDALLAERTGWAEQSYIEPEEHGRVGDEYYP